MGGKIHNYLSMQLDFSTPREVKVTMIPYIKEIVSLFKQYDNSKRTAKTPASEHLFKMHKDVQVLPEKQVAIFHTFVAKNLLHPSMHGQTFLLLWPFCVHELRTLMKMTEKN